MTAADKLEEMLRNIEAGTGVPKTFAFGGRQCGKTDAQTRAFAEDIRRMAANAYGPNKNNDAFNMFGYGRPFGEADVLRAAQRDAKRKHHTQGKMEMLPFGCVQVREEVHLTGPGVHERAASFTVASWAAARLNKQHCEGQRQFEITEIQATLIVGQRHLT